MKHTPFFKYSNEILDIRKEEFESSEVFRFYDKDEVLYDMNESIKTYYGKKFLEILHKEKKLILKPEEFKKFHDFSSKLNLKLKIVNKNN